MTPKIDLIFRHLKKFGPSTEIEIREYTGIPLLTLVRELASMRDKGWIALDEDTSKWYIVNVLFPPMSEEERKGQKDTFFEIERINPEGGPERASLMPSRSVLKEDVFIKAHPWDKYFPTGWMQGSAPTCVGMATAIAQQANYLSCTKDFPSASEMSNVHYNQRDASSGCNLLYDIWYHSVFSAYWAYQMSREVAGMSPDSAGSFTSASVKAWKQIGGVPWSSVLSPKTSSCMPKIPSADVRLLKTQAVNHKIDGYAAISSWEQVKSAIYNNPLHVVLMPINVYDGGYDGNKNLLMSGKLLGAHSLPWCFVDEANDRIGCWNSWGPGYPQVTWIDRAYYAECAGQAFTVLDANEVIIAREIYSRVTVMSNVLCQFYIEGTLRPETDNFVCALEKGKTYTFKAVPREPERVVEPEIIISKYIGESDETVRFTFTVKTIVVPDDTLADRIRRIIDRILKKSGR